MIQYAFTKTLDDGQKISWRGLFSEENCHLYVDDSKSPIYTLNNNTVWIFHSQDLNELYHVMDCFVEFFRHEHQTAGYATPAGISFLLHRIKPKEPIIKKKPKTLSKAKAK